MIWSNPKSGFFLKPAIRTAVIGGLAAGVAYLIARAVA